MDNSRFVKLRENLYIILTGDPEMKFYGFISRLLNELERTSIGRRLIDKYKQVHPTFIIEGDVASAHSHELNQQTLNTIGFPNENKLGNLTEYYTVKGKKKKRPPFVLLAHEMIHAYHFSRGKIATENPGICDQLVWTSDEEYRTIVGFPSKNPTKRQPKITENALLAEIGLPVRFGHSDKMFSNDSPLLIKHFRRIAKKYKKDSNYKRGLPPPVFNLTRKDLPKSNRLYLVVFTSIVREAKYYLMPVAESNVTKDTIRYTFYEEERKAIVEEQFFDSFPEAKEEPIVFSILCRLSHK